MAVTHPSTVRDSLATTIRTALNLGSAAPKLYIGTSSLALPSTGVLATITLGGDFGAPSSGVITATGASGTASATGTAAKCILADSDGNAVVNGAVSTSGAEVNLNTTSITNGDTITISGNVTYTAPS
jgi:hypothetical protein